MTERIPVEASHVAAQHIRELEAWWRINRTAAPNAVREELRRVLRLIGATPLIGRRAEDVDLPGVRRISRQTDLALLVLSNSREPSTARATRAMVKQPWRTATDRVTHRPTDTIHWARNHAPDRRSSLPEDEDSRVFKSARPMCRGISLSNDDRSGAASSPSTQED